MYSKSRSVFNLYLNGVNVHTSNLTQNIDFNRFDLEIGRKSEHFDRGDYWEGKIDDVRIYNRVISPNEVSSLYNLKSSTYELVEGQFSWQQAKADAEAKGGRLAVLDSTLKVSDAYAYLNSIGSWPFIWLGASDADVEDTWKWINGESLSPSNPKCNRG